MKGEWKRLLLRSIPYLITGYFFNRLAFLWRHTRGQPFARLITVFDHLQDILYYPLPSLAAFDLMIGVLGAGMLFLAVQLKRQNRKKFRHGREYGSARWGTASDIAPFIDKSFSRNILLTKTERISMESRPKLPSAARNKNIMCIGGSGSGKTRFFVKPSLMQMHSSFIVTDPKGSLIFECGRMLKHHGYRIKTLNTIDFGLSMHYNPFTYIWSEKDILKLVNTLIVNTKGEGKSGDPFWEKAERLLYTAYIAYLWYEVPIEEQNFAMLIDMLDASETRENDENYKNAIDLAFEELEEKEPDHFAVRQYKKFKLAAGKTMKSILISCGARLAPFDIRELRELTEYDEMDLESIGEEKTALFIIISDTDDTFNFIVSILYSQLFNLLCDLADKRYHGRLPVHVRCLLDEFANIGQIPGFEKLIATIRSREISASIILQSKSQLKAIYKDNADTIEGNVDTFLFLGGKEKSTLKEIEEMLGKETIDMLTTSDTRGQSPSYGANYQKTGKPLMTVDELAVMDRNKCILQINGVRPFFSDKYDITAHPRYKELSDYDRKNEFNVEKYLKYLRRKPRYRVKPEDQVDEAYNAGTISEECMKTDGFMSISH